MLQARKELLLQATAIFSIRIKLFVKKFSKRRNILVGSLVYTGAAEFGAVQV
jgi:hypothetical protein